MTVTVTVVVEALPNVPMVIIDASQGLTLSLAPMVVGIGRTLNFVLTVAILQLVNATVVLAAALVQVAGALRNATMGITNVVRVILPIIVLVASGSIAITNFATMVAIIRLEDAKAALAVEVPAAAPVLIAAALRNAQAASIDATLITSRDAAAENG